MSSTTPIGAVLRGLGAGVIGTGLMTAWQGLSAKLEESGQESQSAAQEQTGDPWEQASAPAKVAKRVGEGVFHKEVSPKLIPLLTNVTHWGYGSSWGILYGITAGSAPRPLGLRAGALFGTGVWLMSYVQLVPMGLYELPWKYPPKALAMDLSYHLVYGTGVAGAYRALARG